MRSERDYVTKILVVDDDSDMTKLLDAFLTGEGYDVVVAADGAAALRATSTTEPDLVLLDIVLGAEDGRDIKCSGDLSKADGAIEATVISERQCAQPEAMCFSDELFGV